MPFLTSFRRRAAQWLTTLLVALCVGTAHAEQASREYAVKAAFLVKLAEFVEWPEKSFATADAPLRIGILGSDPFHRTVDAMAGHGAVKSRPIHVVHSADPSALADCHIVFVAPSEANRIDQAIAQLHGPVLTVGDDTLFASRGGMVGFYLDHGKVRFAINASVAKAAGLQLNAQLLNLARIVDSQGPDP